MTGPESRNSSDPTVPSFDQLAQEAAPIYSAAAPEGGNLVDITYSLAPVDQSMPRRASQESIIVAITPSQVETSPTDSDVTHNAKETATPHIEPVQAAAPEVPVAKQITAPPHVSVFDTFVGDTQRPAVPAFRAGGDVLDVTSSPRSRTEATPTPTTNKYGSKERMTIATPSSAPETPTPQPIDAIRAAVNAAHDKAMQAPEPTPEGATRSAPPDKATDEQTQAASEMTPKVPRPQGLFGRVISRVTGRATRVPLYPPKAEIITRPVSTHDTKLSVFRRPPEATPTAQANGGSTTDNLALRHAVPRHHGFIHFGSDVPPKHHVDLEGEDLSGRDNGDVSPNGDDDPYIDETALSPIPEREYEQQETVADELEDQRNRLPKEITEKDLRARTTEKVLEILAERRAYEILRGPSQKPEKANTTVRATEQWLDGMTDARKIARREQMKFDAAFRAFRASVRPTTTIDVLLLSNNGGLRLSDYTDDGAYEDGKHWRKSESITGWVIEDTAVKSGTGDAHSSAIVLTADGRTWSGLVRKYGDENTIAVFSAEPKTTKRRKGLSEKDRAFNASIGASTGNYVGSTLERYAKMFPKELTTKATELGKPVDRIIAATNYMTQHTTPRRRA